MRPARVTSCGYALAMIALAGGCASTYDSRFAYEPRPASIETFDRATDRTIARTLVSVIGVRRRAADQPHTPAVDLRMLIENVSDDDLRLDFEALRLVSADVRRFLPARSPAPDPLIVHPDSSVSIDLSFPFPPESESEPLDISALNLHWSFDHRGRALDHETMFKRAAVRRVYRSYARPSGWGGYHRWHFHVGFHDHSHW